MVKRIQIKGYKSYRDLEVLLNGINVVIGPNGAGKSNLLDAISLISKIVTSKNLNQAFDAHRGGQLESFYYGENGFEELLNSDRASMSFEVDVELSERTVQETTRLIKEKRKGLDTDNDTRKLVTHTHLRYFIEIEVLPKTGVLRVIDEKLLALRKDGQPKKSRPPFIEKTRYSGHPRLSLRMEGQSRPTEFEVGLDHAILSTSLYEPHHPHIIAFRS